MIGWAVGTAVAVSILIVLVLGLRRPVARLFGAQAAYALWAAPLIRALMPRLPEGAIAIPAKAVLGSASYQLIVTNVAASNAWSWPDALVLLWLGGAAIFLVVQLMRHHRFVAAALQSGRPLPIEGV